MEQHPERKSLSIFAQKMDKEPEPQLEIISKPEGGKTVVVPVPAEKSLPWKKVVHAPWFWSLITLVFCLAVLYASKPALVVKKNGESFEEPKPNHLVIWIISVLASLIVLGVPMALPLLSKFKKTQ
jgi:hypothetical protein